MPLPRALSPLLTACLPAAAALLLAACAQTGSPSGTRWADDGKTSTLPATQPQQNNLTDLPTLLLSGEDRFGAYWSMALKTTFVFDAQGRLKLDSQSPEPMIDQNTPPADDGKCHAWGSGYNQRTTWFPDTALFVNGGRLASVHSQGKALKLRRLNPTGPGEATVAAAASEGREVEYWRVPCVGEQRVESGWRTDRLLGVGDRIQVQPARGKAISLGIPPELRPYLMLSYNPPGEAPQMVPVPMRVVLATVDVPKRRLVLQWQATAPHQPRVYSANWAVMPQDLKPVTQNPAELAMLRRVQQDLRNCPAANTPMNPCAHPDKALPQDLYKSLP